MARRFSSPLMMAVAILVLFSIVYNGMLYMTVYREKGASTDGAMPGNKDANGELIIEQTNDDDNESKIMEKMRAKKEKEILHKLEEEIRRTNEENIKNHLKKLLAEEYGDELKGEIKQELRQEVQSEFTHRVYEAQAVDMTLFETLQNNYMNSKMDDIMSSSAFDEVKDILDKDPKITSSEFDTRYDEVVNKKYKKKEYFQHILGIITDSAPTVEKLTDEENGQDLLGFLRRHVKSEPQSKEYLLNGHVKLGDEKIDNLRYMHSKLVQVLKNLAEPSRKFFSGDGIVISGGGVYFANALVAIGYLREIGSRLPIELILGTRDEYDAYICEELLPGKFNAKCIVMEDEIGKDLLEKLNLKRFQLKALGLFISSFDNIISLDADNYPTKNIDNLLHTEPFISSKWVMWPDIWFRATSPYLYDIIGVEVGEPTGRQGIANDWDFHGYIQKDKYRDIEFHDFENVPSSTSVETGQMVFSKRSHYRSFLLSLYYNIYGYDYYYRMMFQGTPGEGDRETFVHALNVFNEPYFISELDVWLAGYREGEKQDGNFQETTIVQYDPQQGVQFNKDWRNWLRKKNLDTRLWAFQDNPYTKDLVKQFQEDNVKTEKGHKEGGEEITKKIPYKLPEVLFLHVHKPKINPVLNAEGNFDIYTRRNLGLPDAYPEHFGTTDWELKIHSVSKWVACEGLASESFWKDIAKKEQKEVCDKASKYVEFLKKDSKDLDAEKLSYLNN